MFSCISRIHSEGRSFLYYAHHLHVGLVRVIVLRVLGNDWQGSRLLLIYAVKERFELIELDVSWGLLSWLVLPLFAAFVSLSLYWSLGGFFINFFHFSISQSAFLPKYAIFALWLNILFLFFLEKPACLMKMRIHIVDGVDRKEVLVAFGRSGAKIEVKA